MKYILYILIGLAAWFIVAWLPQFIKAWIMEIGYQIRKRKAIKNNSDDAWIYQL